MPVLQAGDPGSNPGSNETFTGLLHYTLGCQSDRVLAAAQLHLPSIEDPRLAVELPQIVVKCTLKMH